MRQRSTRIIEKLLALAILALGIAILAAHYGRGADNEARIDGREYGAQAAVEDER